MEKVTLMINSKEIEVTVKQFEPRVFTAEEFDALVAKAGA
jgi:hypothetical protein